MRSRDFMNSKNWAGRVLVAVATFLLMAGCGGGGSGGVSAVSYTLPSFASSPVAITGSTGNSVNNVAMDALNAGGDSLNAGGGGVSGVSVSGGTTTVQQPLFGAINTANKLIVDSVTGSQNAVGLTQTVSCLSSGSVTETIDTSNNILLQYSSCDEGAGFVANGSIAATNVSGTGSVSSFNISMTYSYNLTFVDTSTSANIAEMGSFDVNIVGTVGSSMTTTITNGTLGITTSLGSMVITNLSENRDCTLFDSSTYICTGYLNVWGSYDAASEYTGYSFHVSVTSGNALGFARVYGALYPYMGTMTITGATGTSGVSSLTITFNNDEMNDTGYVGPDFNFSWDDGSGTTGSGSGYWSGFAYI